MKYLIESMGDKYNILVTLVAIFLLIWGIYGRIKYLCLEKASERIAQAEAHTELSGQEKLALCVLWINQSLPKVFQNAFFKALIEKLVNYVYDNAFDFMKKYVKRKTGYDITQLVNEVKEITVKENQTSAPTT